MIPGAVFAAGGASGSASGSASHDFAYPSRSAWHSASPGPASTSARSAGQSTARPIASPSLKASSSFAAAGRSSNAFSAAVAPAYATSVGPSPSPAPSRRAATASDADLGEPVLTLASPEIKFLSPSRKAAWRLPDTLQRIQQTRSWSKLDARFTAVFLAYIRESEQNSIAELRISNDFDFEPCPPCDFCWTDRYIYTPGLSALRHPEGMARGCDCDDDDCDPATCSCQVIGRQFYPEQYASMDEDEAERGSKAKKCFFAYDENGRLQPQLQMYPGMPIWECNEHCGCDLSACPNRVVQRGRTVGLDIFKTRTRGWGVRTIDAVPRGTFISLYSGELITVKEEERRGTAYSSTELNYLLDLDGHLTKRFCHMEPYERAQAAQHGEAWVEAEKAKDEDAWEQAAARACKDEDDHYAVDSALWGNASRFFNSSCSPNMDIWPVFLSSRDYRHYYTAFFTTRDVAAGEELTFQYARTREATAEEGGREAAADLVKEAAADVAAGRARTVEEALAAAPPSHGKNVVMKQVKKGGKPRRSAVPNCCCGAPNCKGEPLFDVAGPTDDELEEMIEEAKAVVE